MTTRQFLAAAVQLTSTEDVEANLDQAEAQIRRAADRGAQLVAVPENVAYMRIDGARKSPRVGMDHPIIERMGALARELSIDLVLGSVPEPSPVEGKTYNTSVYLDHTGTVVTAYRKLHLFDIDIPGQVTFKESDYLTPGRELGLADTRLGRFGMTICYDLRFPELYRKLAVAGARVLLVPAAFTLQTGKDHWVALLRARAIENQCWVIAPGQFGHHGGERHSYGKSVIIDPWGLVTAMASDGVGFALGAIDYDYQDEVRRGLPCGQHRHELLWDDVEQS